MTSNQLQHAVGVFSSHEDLVQAFNELRNCDFPMNKISVITQKSQSDKQLDDIGVSDSNITSSEGAAMGAIAGAKTGGLLTLVAGLGALLIPGFGPVLAVESVLLALLGSGASATAGGLIGALQGWFLPEEAALLYNDRVFQGNYLVTIEAIEDDIRCAEPVLNRWGIQEWRVVDVPTS